MAKSGSVQLVDVLPNHRFDEAALTAYLEAHMPAFRGALTIRQFQGGQSNPTYHLATPGGAYVLRKKPPGKLLPSAHAVDREVQVLRALEGSNVPVPKVHVLCTDDAVIGQMFYVMDYLEGRIFTDRLLPGCTPQERGAMYDDLNRVLAELHKVDFRAVGLSEFGKPENYAGRQIARWSRQYRDAKVVETPALDRVMEWLADYPPPPDEAAIVHGDYRPGNVLYHPTEPRIIAVLDWELATLGHPLADLAYCCLSYRLPLLGGRGFGDADIAAMGIPSEADFVAQYCRRVGRADPGDWRFFLVLSLFRTAAILVGVHRRALDGNAADARAVGAEIYTVVAERAWEIAQGGD